MPTVTIASSLAQWMADRSTRTVGVNGATVQDVMNAVFAVFPLLRGYVLDEHGSVRHHIVVYIDGEAIRDKDDLTLGVAPDADIHIFQALSGG